MTDRPKHLFLERQTYRRRRLEDGARFLPVLGIMLVMVPLLWAEGAGGVSMSSAILYLFLLWAALVAVAMVLSLYLRDDNEVDIDDPASRAARAASDAERDPNGPGGPSAGSKQEP